MVAATQTATPYISKASKSTFIIFAESNTPHTMSKEGRTLSIHRHPIGTSCCWQPHLTLMTATRSSMPACLAFITPMSFMLWMPHKPTKQSGLSFSGFDGLNIKVGVWDGATWSWTQSLYPLSPVEVHLDLWTLEMSCELATSYLPSLVVKSTMMQLVSLIAQMIRKIGVNTM